MGWSLENTNKSYLYLDKATYKNDDTTILYASWIKNTKEEQEAIETIYSESLIAAIRDNDKKDGYYNIIVDTNNEEKEEYKIQLVNMYEDTTYIENPILGTDKLDGATLVLKYHKNYNRGAHGVSLLILVRLLALSKKPPLIKWEEHITKKSYTFQILSNES